MQGYTYFLIFAPKHRLWVLSKNKKNIEKILLKIFIFYNFGSHCILHGQVFVMHLIEQFCGIYTHQNHITHVIQYIHVLYTVQW